MIFYYMLRHPGKFPRGSLTWAEVLQDESLLDEYIVIDTKTAQFEFPPSIIQKYRERLIADKKRLESGTPVEQIGRPQFSWNHR